MVRNGYKESEKLSHYVQGIGKKRKKWKNPMGRNQNDKKFYI